MAQEILLKNNAVSTLLAGITNVATSMSAQSGHGARFSAPGAGQISKITLYDGAGNIEIVHCSSRTSDTFTIARGQEGTTARAWNAGNGMEERATAGYLNALSQLDRDELVTGKRTFANAVNFAVAGGTADALTATLSPAPTALVNGMQVRVRAAAANTTTAPTLDLNGLGALPIKRLNNTALVVGEIAGANHELLLVYNSTASSWMLLNPSHVLSDRTIATANGTVFSSLICVATFSPTVNAQVGDLLEITATLNCTSNFGEFHAYGTCGMTSGTAVFEAASIGNYWHINVGTGSGTSGAQAGQTFTVRRRVATAGTIVSAGIGAFTTIGTTPINQQGHILARVIRPSAQ